MLGNMFSMSSGFSAKLGLSDEDASRLGEDGATRIRTFRLIVLLAQELRTLMDQQLRPDGLTTQQAALISVVDAIGKPSLSEAAGALRRPIRTSSRSLMHLHEKASSRSLATTTTRASADSSPRARATQPGGDAPPPIRNSCAIGSLHPEPR